MINEIEICLSKFNITTRNEDGSFKPIVDILYELSLIWNDASNEQKDQILSCMNG